jgi:hypothetical protein
MLHLEARNLRDENFKNHKLNRLGPEHASGEDYVAQVTRLVNVPFELVKVSILLIYICVGALISSTSLEGQHRNDAWWWWYLCCYSQCY